MLFPGSCAPYAPDIPGLIRRRSRRPEWGGLRGYGRRNARSFAGGGTSRGGPSYRLDRWQEGFVVEKGGSGLFAYAGTDELEDAAFLVDRLGRHDELFRIVFELEERIEVPVESPARAFRGLDLGEIVSHEVEVLEPAEKAEALVDETERLGETHEVDVGKGGVLDGTVPEGLDFAGLRDELEQPLVLAVEVFGEIAGVEPDADFVGRYLEEIVVGKLAVLLADGRDVRELLFPDFLGVEAVDERKTLEAAVGLVIVRDVVEDVHEVFRALYLNVGIPGGIVRNLD